MASVYEFEGLVPVVPKSSFVHPSAVLIGDVIIGENCYIGPCASLRGDFGRIIVEDGANIQDCCILHSFPQKDMRVRTGGHIGHGAVLHGCDIGANTLIGMNSVIMDGASIGESAFVAAQSFVKTGFVLPPRHLAAGLPARVVRELATEEINWKTNGTNGYQELARRSIAGMRACEPLEQVEASRPRTRWN